MTKSLCLRICAVLSFVTFAPPLAADVLPRAEVEFFEKKIRPVLVEHCYRCHSDQTKRIRAGLRLDTRAGMLKGGDTGPALVPGNPQKSLLIQALQYGETKMPPNGKLPGRVIADFVAWVQKGAVDPRTAKPTKAPPRKIDIANGKTFWSFQKPKRHAKPSVKAKDWPVQTLDWFVLHRMENAGLSPNAAADKRTWIRRVTYDLIGLPPTPAEVDAFLQDESASAHEKVVNRLLDSPHFGERWARMWLDVARYAEDQAHIVGNNKSLFFPNAYLYRDWVIGAFNRDLPYDRFVKLQLAADLLEPKDAKNHVALGYLGLGPKYYRRNSIEVMADEWEDRVDVVGRGFLGLTVACARCHDHKYDPIPTKDYYALAGVFASTEMYNKPLSGKKTGKNGQAKKPEESMHIVREGKVQDLPVFVRGDVKNKGELAKRRFLQVLAHDADDHFQTGSGRLELANAIADEDNPLTARVFVNRVWGQVFGTPIVSTASNFGKLGERPSHPQLLDDLSVRFMANGWSLKWLLREMVMSASYRQSSRVDDKVDNVDPQNRLLSRMPRRRLSVEAWRDTMLRAAGRLDSTVGGKSMDPQDPKVRRRTVYAFVSRFDLNPMLAMFDFPDPNVHAAKRVETTTPLQKLFVLNSPFMAAQAKALAQRLADDIPAGMDDATRQRIRRAYTLLYGRPVQPEEERIALAFLGQDDVTAVRWQRYCHALLASNELMFLD